LFRVSLPLAGARRMPIATPAAAPANIPPIKLFAFIAIIFTILFF
jgi:hypothetical protein